MPPSAVSDDAILALFHLPDVHLKPARVVRMLKLSSRRLFSIKAQLSRLVQEGRLVEHSSPSSRDKLPEYGLPTTAAAADVPRVVQCCCCLTALPNVVFLPCRHQVCCAECWQQMIDIKKQPTDQQLHQLPVNNTVPVKPRCLVCQGPVGRAIQTYL